MENLRDKKGNRLHINNDSLEKAWNSEDIRQARLKMIKGESVPACVKCVQQEERGYRSMRDTGEMEQNISATDKDGSVAQLPRSMELHLGNLCNLKCKMCGQQYSNQIGKELLEIGKNDPDFIKWITKESGNVNIWTNNLSVEYAWFQNPKIKKKLFDYITSNITDMVVIGGEPTVIPEFWELFAHLEEHDRLKDLTITLTTNLTNVNPKMTAWLPKLKHWTVWASVDGLGDRTEYIRYPSNFKKVCDNLNFYKGLLDHNNGNIVLSPAIQLLNIDQLDEILQWWLDFSGGALGKKFGISWMAQVWYPTICNYDILPSDYKSKIADKLLSSRESFAGHTHIIKFYENQIQNLRREVYSEQEKVHFQKAFIRYNDTQDRHRKGKTWRELLPELEQSLTKSLM
jgi:sulfatase maturation enzyme AslB (radical SAM superfamily)